MRYENKAEQVIYFNPVRKGGRDRWLLQAASGQIITGRDRQKFRSRTFAQEHQAAAWLKRNGYEAKW